ncbi:MAG: TIGR02450 family Trp-rich protein [Synechococcus sp.]
MAKRKHRKQKFPHLLGSKWTAVKPVMGWRHFQVKARQERSGVLFAHLGCVCDDSVELWLNAKVLKNRQLWIAGWQTLEDMFPERYGEDE